MTLVKQMAGAAALGAAMVIGCGLSASSAWAGYIVTLTQQGSNVVATGSGPIDLTGLSLTGDGGAAASVVPSFGSINTGPPVASVDQYMTTGPIGGPTSFGSGGSTLADTGSGSLVGIVAPVSRIILPAGYASGGPLSDTSTYDDQTFASLGVTPGVYEWTWGTGPNQNFTLDAVPEPSSLLLLGVALAGLPFLRTRRRIRASR